MKILPQHRKLLSNLLSYIIIYLHVHIINLFINMKLTGTCKFWRRIYLRPYSPKKRLGMKWMQRKKNAGKNSFISILEKGQETLTCRKTASWMNFCFVLILSWKCAERASVSRYNFDRVIFAIFMDILFAIIRANIILIIVKLKNKAANAPNYPRVTWLFWGKTYVVLYFYGSAIVESILPSSQVKSRSLQVTLSLFVFAHNGPKFAANG